MKLRGLALALGLSLSGCASMSGYDANTGFSCKAPDGVLCESMSGIYANAQAQNLPGQRITHGSSAAASDTPVEGRVMSKPIYSGSPIRSSPRVLRIWFAPWEDSDGDLHDQNYVYLQVDSGRWLIEHNRRRIQDAYRPVHAPAAGLSNAGKAAPLAAARTVAAAPVAAGGSENEADSNSVDIGVRQDRMNDAQAAEMMSGILRPGAQTGTQQ